MRFSLSLSSVVVFLVFKVFSLLLCERESGLFFFCGLLMMILSLEKKKKSSFVEEFWQEKENGGQKREKKRFLLQEEGNLSLSEGALWPIKSCFPLFFSLFLSFSFFCGLINTRSFFDPLRARHHHLREKKRAHTHNNNNNNNNKARRRKQKIERSVKEALLPSLISSVCLNRRRQKREREREKINEVFKRRRTDLLFCFV